MPPRKRAETKPDEPDLPVSETPPEDPAAPTPEEPSREAATKDEPKKSDLQTVEQPCPICIPNGWVDGAFSMGCEHGTWVRDSA